MDLGRVQLGDHIVSKIAPARIAKALRKADYGRFGDKGKLG
ncbi:hypothetical protein [uncultured Allobaculum sp.]|nr:hypothetical protein [uncultured Allobaculum sp.]